MPNPLFIFFSYASEDQKLVDAIAEALDTAFRNSIASKNMSQFEPGVSYRQEIDDALDRADILLVVASGKEKLSHTFTGYEVGYFRKSQRTRALISEDPKLERLILPIAALTELPDTVSEIQGIKIPKSDQLFVHPADPNTAETAMYRLLIRVDQIINDLDKRRRNADEAARINKILEDTSKDFSRKLALVLRRIPIEERRPSTKLTIYLSPDLDRHEIELHSFMTITVAGPTGRIFSIPVPPTAISWQEFERALGGSDIALSWRDAMEAMVAGSINENDFSYFDHVLLSADGEHLFRIFVSKSTIYFDQSREIEIYIIPVLYLPDVGDPVTTNLGKALEIALRYRSLFLEQRSPYTRPMFGYETDDKKFVERARALLKELRILFVRGKQARLDDPHSISELFGSEPAAVVEIDQMATTWAAQKVCLNTAIEKILIGSLTIDDKKGFLEVLDNFCNALEKMNNTYLDVSIRRLNEVIAE